MSTPKHKYIAEIPARIGSNRVKRKNIRMLNGKPMIQYAIDACKNASKVDKVFVNTDSDLIGRIAIDNEVGYYKRLDHLASDDCKQDEFNYDFLMNMDCEAIIMVNPVSPLIEGSDIDSAISYFEEMELDSLISTKQEKLHAFFQDNPLNFCTDSLLPATQDIAPVDICTWNICIWRKETFIKSYEENGYAAFSGKVGLWTVDPIKAIKISYEEDFRMAEEIIKSREGRASEYKPEYYEEVS
jgi:CMP-N-acetylneuraminic acid synthetase